MSRDRWERNLKLLCRGVEDYAQANNVAIPDPPPPEAALLSRSLYLAHSAASDKFSGICGAGRLLSATQLAPRTGEALRPNSAEVLLGTADSVFFYVAPFRSPHTGCGLLFARSLEEYHKGDGVATPFDSGGLVAVFSRPDPAEPPREFLWRHELPVPDHREYLRLSLGILFEKPVDYVRGADPRWPGPIGVTGGDRHRWTHEVRIPGQVPIRSGHLQAVFAPRSRVAADPEISRLFEWCKRERVDRVSFNTSRGDDFEALRWECVDYICARLQ